MTTRSSASRRSRSSTTIRAGGKAGRRFTNEVLDACLKATNELWAEISAKNADFKKAIDAMQAYRSDQYLWWQVAEYTNDSFMIRSRTRG
jgi:TRAP-type mannitol/chloroaromatic compound transport system substrate-binding protein